MDKLNSDHNLLGRIGALAIIAVALIGVGRITGYCSGACPFMGGRCVFSR